MQARPPVHIAVAPSVSGGLGHITRSLKLATALSAAESRMRITYVLNGRDVRPLNREVVERTGYAVRLIPSPARRERNHVIQGVLGDVDVMIDDTERRLVPYRRVLPRLKTWVSIPMLPLRDELFMEWPLLEHVDSILYTYPPVMPVPDELIPFRDRLTVTGPLLHPDDMPARASARERLRIDKDSLYVTYAPRGFPFGEAFGLVVLGTLVRAIQRLRRELPSLTLVLTAVPDVQAVQPAGLPPLTEIPGVIVEGVLPPERVRDYLAGADLAVVEGTSTLFDAAVARTPVLMVPGPIDETTVEGQWVREQDAAVVLRWEEATEDSMYRALGEILTDAAATHARSERLRSLVGVDGRDKAVETILRLLRDRGQL